ncbi:MAG TPA: phosphoenolpyruvate carboxylase, partial [Flavisolibacter sp.]|nr:phosphoenolpyruvate carboxylase [Flavisolibacter sp.]
MDHLSSRELENFKNSVGIKFQLYNSLFTSLPFHRIEKTGILLSLFLAHCEEGYKKRQSPKEIVEEFFQKFTSLTTEQEQRDLLFRFVQYAERQVVLFDAVEDAAFAEINDTIGIGTLKQLETKVVQEGKSEALIEKLKEFSIALVLTAHPTQFYPGSVLGIINDLSNALKANNAEQVNRYLQQLGKTPLLKKQRPTPYDEAISLVWYLENVFYNAVGKCISYLKQHFAGEDQWHNSIIKMGFWPGGDRDGNPNVSSETTLKVAEALRSSIIRCYYREVRSLKRRLTFKGVDTILAELETKLFQNVYEPGNGTELLSEEIIAPLASIREIIIYQHNNLFLERLDQLIDKVTVFGVHFASLDIRQESTVHGNVLEAIARKEDRLPSNYDMLREEEKMNVLVTTGGNVNPDHYEGLVKDTLDSVLSVKTIQQKNGEMGCNRYIISQCKTALNVLEVYALFLLCGWKKEELSVDIVPLFETIEDLKNARGVME